MDHSDLDRLAALERRVAALEALLTPDASPAAPEAAETYEAAASGIVGYAGQVLLGERPLAWQIQRPVAGLLTTEVEPLAAVLAALGSPQRIGLLRALLAGPLSSQQLQEALGTLSPGQLYHHLRELTGLGIVEQQGRSQYQIAPRCVVPFLTALALAYDIRNP